MFLTVFQSLGMSAKFGEQFESCVHGMRPFLTEEWKPLCPAVVLVQFFKSTFRYRTHRFPTSMIRILLCMFLGLAMAEHLSPNREFDCNDFVLTDKQKQPIELKRRTSSARVIDTFAFGHKHEAEELLLRFYEMGSEVAEFLCHRFQQPLIFIFHHRAEGDHSSFLFHPTCLGLFQSRIHKDSILRFAWDACHHLEPST